MSGNYSAMSRLPLRVPADVIWSCLWDGSIAINAATDVASSGYFFKSTITGTDSRGHTGSEIAGIFGGTGNLEAYYITDPGDITEPDHLVGLNNTWSVTTAPTTAPGGKGNEIIITQKKRFAAVNSGSRPQCGVLGNLNTGTRRSICIKQKFKLSSNLAAVFDSFAPSSLCWMEILAFKQGDNGIDDSRFSFQAIRKVGETGLRFRIQIDASSGSTPFTGWPVDTSEGSLTPGVWYEYTSYIEQPAAGGHLNTTDGIWKFIIQNLETGEFIPVVNRVGGGPFYGPLDKKLTRMYACLGYTGGWPATGQIVTKFSDLELSSNPRYPLNKLS